MRDRHSLTQERLKSLLDYDPEVGTLTWKVNRGSAKAHSEAGCLTHHGYRVVMVLGRSYYAHRLIWFWMTGAWPECEIDHKDGDGGNNAFSNLREAAHAENHQNRGRITSAKTSAFTGVSWHSAAGKWRAAITIRGKFHHLGCFDDEETARESYLEAKAKLHIFQPTPRES